MARALAGACFLCIAQVAQIDSTIAPWQARFRWLVCGEYIESWWSSTLAWDYLLIVSLMPHNQSWSSESMQNLVQIEYKICV